MSLSNVEVGEYYTNVHDGDSEVYLVQVEYITERMSIMEFSKDAEIQGGTVEDSTIKVRYLTLNGVNYNGKTTFDAEEFAATHEPFDTDLMENMPLCPECHAKLFPTQNYAHTTFDCLKCGWNTK